MRRTQLAGIAIGTAIGAAALAVPAAAAPGPPWSAADTASQAGQTAGVGVARLDNRGNGWLAFTQCSGGIPAAGCGSNGTIQSRRVLGSRLGPPRRVSTGGAQRFILDLEASGQAILHWLLPNGNRWRQARTLRSARFGPALRSRPPEGGGAFVVENARGQALSVLTVLGRPFSTLLVRYRNGRRAPWQRARRLRRLPALAAGTGAIDARGRASVFWAGPLPAFGGENAVQPKVSDRTASTGLFRTQNLTRSSVATFNPVFAANARGDQVAAWNVCTTGRFLPASVGGGCDGSVGVQVARRAAGATRFGPPRTVTDVGARDVGAPFVSFTNTQALVAWQDSLGVNVATGGRGSGRMAVRKIGEPGPAGSTSITTLFGNPRGEAIVGWTRQESGPSCTAAIGIGTCFVPYAAVRQRNGVWNDPATLDAPGLFVGPPLFAINRTGRAMALWLKGGAPPGGATELRYATNRIG